eukprot:TRINITY_DN17778_c0_g2_i1.p1 TRINITY_DN17778_c0_g2~~TRINITY_DN17778_c0_g2_i1.p1  ORF type:complete len:1203 (-),score=258.08 TRINITY_DN17778_c0_g2_i1:496-4062(-)
MVTPWKEPRSDPPDLPENEVTLTASIRSRCRDDYSDRILVEFCWWTPDGILKEPVPSTPLKEWEKVGEPEISEDQPEPLPQPAEGEAEAQRGPVMLETLRFEKQSPTLKSGCAFARYLAVAALRVRVHYPDPARPPPPASPLPAESTPAEADPKAKAKAKAKGKKAATPEPAVAQQPAERQLVAELVLPLAPLLVQKSKGIGGPKLSEDFLAFVQCPGLKALDVSVDCSGPLLPDEVVQHLNPLLLSLNGVHRLPMEVHLGQQQHVYAVVEGLGQRRTTLPVVLGPRHSARFQVHLVHFVGTWPQHELRQHLQLGQLMIEVHDRDKQQFSSGGDARVASDSIPPGFTDSIDDKLAAESPYGVARFALAELLNPRLSQPVSMRVDLEAAISKKMTQRGLGGSRNLKVSTVMKGDADARQLLQSIENAAYEFMPGFSQAGSWVGLTLTLARPLLSSSQIDKIPPKPPRPETPPPEPEELDPKAKAKAKPKAAPEKPRTPTPEPVEGDVEEPEEPVPPGRYERFARIVIVVDYRRTTVVKKLINTVHSNNSEVMQLDVGQARAMATVKLTDEQKDDLSLDILTGFILLDRKCRIIVIEGLREGAIHKVLEVIGTRENTPKLKLLYNPDLGFRERIYKEFNLVLKQVKLRQPTLEGLSMRPNLCLPGRSDELISRGLAQLLEVKRANRIHVLKLMNSFPCSDSLIGIETQYGDFVTEKELQGGCLDEGKSTRSGTIRSKTDSYGHEEAGSKAGSRTASKAQADEKEQEEDSEEGGSEVEEVKVRNAKIYLKAPLDTCNDEFARTLLERTAQPAQDMVSLNKAALTELSDAQRLLQETSGTARRVGPKKVVDTEFLEPGAKIHIYSGQALNTSELQMKALRSKMAGQEGQKMWTYSEERNSGCFPMLDKEVPLEKMLREEVPQNDSREPFRCPKPREAAEIRKHPMDVSEARKDELRSRWVENEMHSESEKKEIVRGAFDAQSLGMGGAHIIPLRRPVLFEAGRVAQETVQEEEDQPPKPMRFQARASVALENVTDKYQRTLLDGPPKSLGLRFDQRKAPRTIRKKFGDTKKGNETLKAPPASFAKDEEYLEDKANYDYLTDFMRSISRPLKTPRDIGNAAAPKNTRSGAGDLTAKPPEKLLPNTVWKDMTTTAKQKGSFQATMTTGQATAPLSARGPCSGSNRQVRQPLSAR